MAQQVTFWKMEGASDIALRVVRLRRLSDLNDLMQNIPEGTDCITVDRTDKQSDIIHEVWHSKRYIDLNDRTS